MRAVFGIVGLLIALAIVGLIAARQLRATSQATQQAMPETVRTAPAPGATVREQAQTLQQGVKSGVADALQQGADKRGEEATK